MKNKVVTGQGNKPSNVSLMLKDLRWDFEPFGDHEWPTVDAQHYARAFSSVTKAMQTVGWVEHTGDWDPYVVITFWDDTQMETNPGYYEAFVEGPALCIEAPEIGELDAEQLAEMPSQYIPRDRKHRGVPALYMVPIAAIKTIVIHG